MDGRPPGSSPAYHLVPVKLAQVTGPFGLFSQSSVGEHKHLTAGTGAQASSPDCRQLWAAGPPTVRRRATSRSRSGPTASTRGVVPRVSARSPPETLSVVGVMTPSSTWGNRGRGGHPWGYLAFTDLQTQLGPHTCYSFLGHFCCCLHVNTAYVLGLKTIRLRQVR